MQLEESLRQRCSKTKMMNMAHYVAGNPAHYAELIDLILHGRPPVPQYGAWVLQHASNENPNRIIPHLRELLELIDGDAHDAIKRAVLRTLAMIDVPKKEKEQVINICFRLLEDNKQAVAIKVFSMSALWRACQGENDLLQELGRQIQIQMPTGSAGFKSRGRKILKAIDRL